MGVEKVGVGRGVGVMGAEAGGRAWAGGVGGVGGEDEAGGVGGGVGEVGGEAVIHLLLLGQGELLEADYLLLLLLLLPLLL